MTSTFPDSLPFLPAAWWMQVKRLGRVALLASRPPAEVAGGAGQAREGYCCAAS